MHLTSIHGKGALQIPPVALKSVAHMNITRVEPAENSDRYRFLADAMPQIVWTAKPDGNID